MITPILTASARYLLPLMLVFSLVLLVRGHNLPGGGFVGGLVAALTFVYFALAHGISQARSALRVPPATLIASGLALATVTGLLGLSQGAFLAGLWPGITAPGMGALGSPLLFDTGVYLSITGAILAVFFELAE